MIKFILRRLAYGVAVLFFAVVLITSIIYLAPVDPARLTFGQRTDVESVAAKKKELGLDKPLYVQLLYYLRDISPLAVIENTERNQEKYSFTKIFPVGSNKYFVLKAPYLRESYQSGRKVSDILKTAIPKTAILAFISISIGSLLGILLGVLASIKQYSWFDNTAVITSVLGYSQPSYVTGILIAVIFAYYLYDYTGLEMTGSLTEVDDFGEERYAWKNLILPAIALGVRPVAIVTQLTRSAMLDVLSQDYIRTAKAKGLSFAKVIGKHALRNALNPVITAISGWFAALLAGAFFVETVFDYKGIGFETVTALLNFDLPVVLGVVLVASSFFVLINILVDIAYAFVDPRIRVGK